jgi:proteasome accessory factor B
VSGGRKTFVLEPYTLIVYKKGLYLAGLSHHHREIRTFALDGFRDVEWLKGDRFEYPADYRPEQITEGAFGIIRGEPAHVRILFDPGVARYVQRRQWHASQRFRSSRQGLEMTMDVRGTVEMTNWLIGFGDKAQVLEPPALRDEVGAELRRAAKRYG